uniref:Uncharacterized protein n=1 Tax=Heterorhabditis bacteriophora TaxID=37862 RepID=A0A1I7XRA8_HETBA
MLGDLAQIASRSRAPSLPLVAKYVTIKDDLIMRLIIIL